MQYINQFKSDTLYFIPLGGVEEIGMNLSLYGYNNFWVMVDLGITFTHRMGVEVVMPDISFLDHIDLAAIVITHAHEDHIGAIPYLWSKIKKPIYATHFTLELIKRKLTEHKLASAELHGLNLETSFKLGCFEFEYVNVTHSIPESNMLAIRTPIGTVMHSGDWKLDEAPVLGPVSNMERLKEIGDKGVIALVCDSTNCFEDGFSGTELQVQEGLIAEIAKHTNSRIIISCFASNVARVKSCILAAHKNGRKVAVVGRSLKRMEEISRAFKYFDGTPGLIDEQEAMNLPRGKCLIICTGSQGETRAALSRIAHHKHPIVQLDRDDVVIFSSRVIPGNERDIGEVQNELVKNHVRVVVDHKSNIHVSGHPCRGELLSVYKMLRPHSLIPVHGEQRHLAEHIRFARSCGITSSVKPINGSVVAFHPNAGKMELKLVGNVQAGKIFLDGVTLVPSTNPLFVERDMLAAEGVVFVSIALKKARAPVVRVSVVGVTCSQTLESANLSKRVLDMINNAAKKAASANSQTQYGNGPSLQSASSNGALNQGSNSVAPHSSDGKSANSPKALAHIPTSHIIKNLGSFFRDTYRKSPKIVVHFV